MTVYIFIQHGNSVKSYELCELAIINAHKFMT